MDAVGKGMLDGRWEMGESECGAWRVKSGVFPKLVDGRWDREASRGRCRIELIAESCYLIGKQIENAVSQRLIREI